MPKFNALITSYDTAINDAHFLRKIKWECLIVDEAHRLKNNESKFFKISSTISTKHKVLLTGKQYLEIRILSYSKWIGFQKIFTNFFNFRYPLAEQHLGAFESN